MVIWVDLFIFVVRFDYLTHRIGYFKTVTGRDLTTSLAVEFSNTTNSTSKTTGAVKIGGGLG